MRPDCECAVAASFLRSGRVLSNVSNCAGDRSRRGAPGAAGCRATGVRRLDSMGRKTLEAARLGAKFDSPAANYGQIAILWLAGLTPFFLSYGLANWGSGSPPQAAARIGRPTSLPGVL